MKLLREPLVHFLLLGAVLFGVFALVSDRSSERTGHIVVTPGHLEHLTVSFTRTWQRPPTAPELAELIDDYIREEVLYREAVAMGLDRDDTIIRRRLRQKLEFLTEETAEARQLLAQLATGAAAPDTAALGDPFLLPPAFALSSRSEIARLFGNEFATQLQHLKPGRWAGPIESGYGMHLVYIRERVDGRVPARAEVREAVQREWFAARRKAVNEQFYQHLRARCTAVVERLQAAGNRVPTDAAARTVTEAR